MSERAPASFGKWLAGHEAEWAEAWARVLSGVCPTYRDLPPERRLELGATCAHAFASRLTGGEEASLNRFCAQRMQEGVEQGVPVADLAEMLDAGRTSLLELLAASKVPQKAPARELVERIFRRALRHLLESFQGYTETRSASEQARLAASEEGAAQAKREWSLLDQILSGMEAGIVLLDGQRKVTWMNRTMPRELLSTSPEEAVGKACQEVLKSHVEDCDTCAGGALGLCKPAVQHLRGVETARGPRDYLKLTRPLMQAGEGGPQVMQIFLDVTSQQEVERSLERTKELVRNILDSSESAIVSTDTAGRITLVNRMAERLLGRPERELLGTAAQDYYAAGKAESFRLMRRLMKSGALRDWETIFLGAEGHSVPVRLTASLLKDERGRVVGTMGFAQDISVEEALRREVANRNGYLLSILHGSADGLVTVDAEGRVASWNRGASELMGIQPEEALGKPLAEVMDPSKVRPLTEPQGMSKESQRFEYRVDLPRGGHDLLVTRTEIVGTGEAGASIVLKDVTELKQLQRDLAEAEHLAELGRLAASIAHEIKNPIAGLRGAMEMMGGVHAQQDPRFAVFGEALTQIRRLDALVKDLLAYARPVRIKTEPVPVYLLVDASLLLTKDALSEARLTLETEVSEELPAVMVDPILIQQVLVNLVMNAIQATPAGGQLSIQARVEAGQMVAVSVADTGCGISAEVRENIFKPFFTTKHVGTGLGLSIVQRLLRAHGGYCEVASATGEGTTFTIHLPTGVRSS